MCEPTTLTLIATAVVAAGTVAQGVQSYQQGKYQAEVARNNQIIALRKAEQAGKQGRVAEQRYRRQAAAALSDQRANLAAGGVDLGSGSALDLQVDAAGLAELDALTIRHNATLDAAGYQAQGMNFLAQGRAARSQGNNALFASTISAAGTALGGASRAAYMRQQLGLGNSTSSGLSRNYVNSLPLGYS